MNNHFYSDLLDNKEYLMSLIQAHSKEDQRTQGLIIQAPLISQKTLLKVFSPIIVSPALTVVEFPNNDP
jgi:hypothetical protein